MTKADEMNALADRCERERASRKLDGAIAAALGLKHGPWEKGHIESRSISSGPEAALAYTTSLDAAFTLVPEGMEWTITHKNGGLDCPSVFVGRSLDWSSEEAHTPALALCAAALRAKAALSHPDPAPMRSERSERATSLLPVKEGE